MTTPVDLERMAAFSDGSPEGLRMLMELFVTDSAETLRELLAAVDRRDRQAVELLAHRAGGTCSSCGAHRLAQLLARLEQAAAGRNDVGGDAALLRDIREAHEAAVAFVRNQIERQEQT